MPKSTSITDKQKELERQLEQENEELKAEAELTDTVDIPRVKMEEIVEEDGIVYDYQNANGEVIKRDQQLATPPPPQHYLQSPNTNQHHWSEIERNKSTNS